MCPLLSVLSGSEFFSCIFLFFAVYILFLGTAVHIRQIHIVLLQCTVIILLFYLRFTKECLASSLYPYKQ
jgi:hypothetical protein